MKITKVIPEGLRKFLTGNHIQVERDFKELEKVLQGFQRHTRISRYYVMIITDKRW